MIPFGCPNPDTGGPHMCSMSPREDQAMSYGKMFLIAAPVALSLLAAPAAHAEWGHRGGGWGGYHGGYEHRGGNGGAIAGALLGLGAAAVIGGVIASQPAYYPPPPV